MSTGTFYYNDLYNIHNIVQNTLVIAPKELLVGVLRDEFSQDSYFRYVRDQWGFPLTPDITDFPQTAGIEDDSTTRLYIGEKYRADNIFYPSILVGTGGFSYTPISFNRNKETVKYSATRILDGYGNETFVTSPTHFVFNGAWEGTLTVDIKAKDPRARDELTEICMMLFSDIRFEELTRAGLLIKKASCGSPSEQDDRNDKIYSVTINLDVRGEWRREIPVENIVDVISICVDFGNLQTEPYALAPNLTANTTIELINEITNS